MPSSADLKRRIKSVKSTQKITKAMKLVSAAKFAKAAIAVKNARPYSQALTDMTARLLRQAKELNSVYLQKREEKKILVLVMSTDRGLCGGLNGNLFRYTWRWILEKRKAGSEIQVATWGRKGQSFFRMQMKELFSKEERAFDKPNFLSTKKYISEIIKLYADGQFDAIYIAFPKFKSAMEQSPVVHKLLPVTMEVSEATDTEQKKAEIGVGEFIVEPNIETMVDRLVERKVVAQLLAARLEGQASEFGARMSAMDSATRNANDVIKKLTLKYNRARQAAITKELIEIVSGAEAL